MALIMERNLPQIGRDIIPQSPLDRLKPLRDNKSRRESTFNKYPKNAAISAKSLCDNGFYYVGDGQDDRVQCAYCGGVLSKFDVDDNVRYEHRRYFPHCSLVKEQDRMQYGPNVSPVVESDGGVGRSNFSNVINSGLESDVECDGISSVKEKSTIDSFLDVEAKFPQYKTKKARLESFKTWPNKYLNLIPKPEELVDACLFYTGKDDGTQCYACGNLLMEWENGDKPKLEHDKWFPDCPLARK